jgi:hypothetical protein
VNTTLEFVDKYCNDDDDDGSDDDDTDDDDDDDTDDDDDEDDDNEIGSQSLTELPSNMLFNDDNAADDDDGENVKTTFKSHKEYSQMDCPKYIVARILTMMMMKLITM